MMDILNVLRTHLLKVEWMNEEVIITNEQIIKSLIR